MTFTLYDALYPAGIPLNIPADALVAAYVDHPEVVPPGMVQLAARFPNHVNVSISAHGHLAQIFDVESGAITPAAVPALLKQARAAGIDPTVYCLDQTRPAVESACTHAAVAFPHWWDGDEYSTPYLPPGWDGSQWLHAGPYDQSIITDQLAQILTAGGHVPSGTGTLITEDDMTPDQAAQLNSVFAILQNGVPGSFLANMNTHIDTAAGNVISSLGATVNGVPAAVVAALPPAAGGDIQPLIDLINGLPAATVAAIKSAL